MLLIDREIIHMNAYLPVELAKLSRVDEEAAIKILRAWGEGTAPLKTLWAMVQTELKKYE